MPGTVAPLGEPRLFQKYESLRGRIPWTSLADSPTPVERLDNLGKYTGSDIWVKRDDLTGPQYGGNKVRKLEFLLAHAKSKGFNKLVTMGGLGTNHGLATALYGRKMGFDVALKLMDQPITDRVLKSLALFTACGAKVDYCKGVSKMAWEYYVRHRILEPESYFIPAGGSNPIGVLGYVEAGLEIAKQVKNHALPHPERVFVAAGTCGTMAGLALGFDMAGLKTSITGVRVTPSYAANRNKVMSLALRTHAFLKHKGATISEFRPPPQSLNIDSSQIGVGYGYRTIQGTHAITQAREQEGLHLESTYTGKAFAALLDYAPLAKGPLLFINTYNSASLDFLEESVDIGELPETLLELFPKRKAIGAYGTKD